MSTTGEGARGLRDRPLGRVLILVVVLVAALIVARSCGSTEAAVSKDEAIEIARGVIDYDADAVQIRFVKRGLSQTEIWLVALGQTDTAGVHVRDTNVLVDADTGEIVDIQPVR